MNPTRSAVHPSGEILESYALGTLSEPDLENFETHLLVCTHCQEALAEVDGYVAAMRGALREAASTPTPVSRRERWWDRFRLSIPVPAMATVLAVLTVSVALTYKASEDAPAGIVLRSEREGAIAPGAHGPAKAALDLSIQSGHLTIGPEFRAQIVDAAGRHAWSGGFDAQVLHVRTPLAAGTYWVRLYDGQKLVQEYGLQLE